MAEMKRICVCRGKYDLSRFMIECESCSTWYHGDCINITEEKAVHISSFVCRTCIQSGQHSNAPNERLKLPASCKLPLPVQFGQLSLKSIASVATCAADKTQPDFQEFLSIGLFARSGVHEAKALDLTLHELRRLNLTQPILVEDRIPVGLRVPTVHLTLQDIERVVGLSTIVQTLDVREQKKVECTFDEWKKGCTEPANLLYKTCGTQFEGRVFAPEIVCELDWRYQFQPPAQCYNPTMINDKNLYGGYAQATTYMDFTFSPSGTSTWLHTLSGSIILYLVPYSNDNMAKYKEWYRSALRNSLFFGNLVEKCIKVEITSGSTILIPSGWIYAMYCPSTTMYFTGTFQHSLTLQTLIETDEVHHQLGSCFCSPWMCAPKTIDMLWRAVGHYLNRLRDQKSALYKNGLTTEEKQGLGYMLKFLKEKKQIPHFVTTPVQILNTFEVTLTRVKIHKMKDLTTRSPAPPSQNCRCHAKKCQTCRNCIRRHCSCGGAGNRVTPVTPSPNNSPEKIQMPQGSVSSLLHPELDFVSHDFEQAFDSVWDDALLPSRGELGMEVGEMVFVDAFDMSIPTDAEYTEQHDSSEASSGSSINASELNSVQLNITDGVPAKEDDKHRTSCHRCGNLRKKNVRCPNCPHIFCQKCAEKLAVEHGNHAFINGCPVCLEMCCCGKNRSVTCIRKYHCYKKCPSTKRQPLKQQPVTEELIFPPDFSSNTEELEIFPVSVAADLESACLSDLEVDLVELDNLP